MGILNGTVVRDCVPEIQTYVSKLASVMIYIAFIATRMTVDVYLVFCGCKDRSHKEQKRHRVQESMENLCSDRFVRSSEFRRLCEWVCNYLQNGIVREPVALEQTLVSVKKASRGRYNRRRKGSEEVLGNSRSRVCEPFLFHNIRCDRGFQSWTEETRHV